jgi:hypothetical protein
MAAAPSTIAPAQHHPHYVGSGDARIKRDRRVPNLWASTAAAARVAESVSRGVPTQCCRRSVSPADPKEDMLVVYMMQSPSQRQHYRGLLRDVIYASLVK